MSYKYLFLVSAFFAYPFTLLFSGFLRLFCTGRRGDAVLLDWHAFIYYVRFTVKYFIPLKLRLKKCDFHFCRSSWCLYFPSQFSGGQEVSCKGRWLSSLPSEHGMGEIQELLLLLFAVEGQNNISVLGLLLNIQTSACLGSSGKQSLILL